MFPVKGSKRKFQEKSYATSDQPTWLGRKGQKGSLLAHADNRQGIEAVDPRPSFVRGQLPAKLILASVPDAASRDWTKAASDGTDSEQ